MNALPLRIAYLVSVGLGMAGLVGSYLLPLGSMSRPGPGFFPLLVSVIIVVLSLSALFTSLWRDKEVSEEVEPFPRGKDLRRVFSIVLLLATYIGSLNFLGFGICSAGVMLAALRLLGMQGWIKSIAVSVATAVVATFVFSSLGVPLPKGLIFD